MPIYAYRCEACGFSKDVLQKVSDAPMTVCPSCGQSAFKKQLTAAGFQLKGTGWYATDFRGNNSGKPAADADKKAETPADANAASGASSAAPASDAPKSTQESSTSSSSGSDNSSGA